MYPFLFSLVNLGAEVYIICLAACINVLILVTHFLNIQMDGWKVICASSSFTPVFECACATFESTNEV